MILLSRNIRDFPRLRAPTERVKSTKRLISSINRFAGDYTFFPRTKFTRHDLRKIAAPAARSRLIFSRATKEGSALPSRCVDLGTHRHRVFYIHKHIHTDMYVRVISPSFRNIRWRGKVVEGETYLAGFGLRTLLRVSRRFARAGCVSSTRS